MIKMKLEVFMAAQVIIYPVLDLLSKAVWVNSVNGFLLDPPKVEVNWERKKRIYPRFAYRDSPRYQIDKGTSLAEISGYTNFMGGGSVSDDDNKYQNLAYSLDGWTYLSPADQMDSPIIKIDPSSPIFKYGAFWGAPQGFSLSDVRDSILNSFLPFQNDFVTSINPSVEDNFVLTQDANDFSLLAHALLIQNKHVVGNGKVTENGVVVSNIDQVVIAPSKDGVAIQDTLTFATTATASTSVSTTRGISQTSSQKIGVTLTDAIQILPGVNLGLDLSTANSATVNTSSTKAQTVSKSISQSNSITLKVEPGQSILAEQKYLTQEITIPFSLPATISDEATVGINIYDLPKRSWVYTGSSALFAAADYGLIPISSVGYYASSFNSSGEVKNVAVGYFEATDSPYKQQISVYSSPSIVNPQALKRLSLENSGESTESKVLTREDTFSKRIAHDQLPTVLINGKQETVGLYYSAEDDQPTSPSLYHLGGSYLDDIINMTLKGQSAYSYGGNDRVYGSRFNDKIYLDGGLDLAQGGEGDDTITSYSGAHLIDSGSGSDTINIHLDKQEDNLGAHEINLGHGNDVLSIFKNNREIDSIIAVVNDFSSADSIHLNGFDDLTGEVIAGSLYLKESDQFILKLASYSGSFDSAGTRGELVEYSMLNAGLIDFDPGFSGSYQDVVNKMATAQVLHHLDPFTEYSDLLKNKNMLNQSLDAVAIALDLDSKKFLSEGLDSADQFNSISALTSHVIQSVIGNKDTGIMDYIAWL